MKEEVVETFVRGLTLQGLPSRVVRSSHSRRGPPISMVEGLGFLKLGVSIWGSQ